MRFLRERGRKGREGDVAQPLIYVTIGEENKGQLIERMHY